MCFEELHVLFCFTQLLHCSSQLSMSFLSQLNTQSLFLSLSLSPLSPFPSHHDLSVLHIFHEYNVYEP
ncbi:hypothetical protein HanPSC8_Chr08g0319551 [Helianthus annuus]|nr:hypothetical protein HanPSC8_Chr08g0319551 [Helianthus annuus]